MVFVWAHVLWFGLWVAVNTLPSFHNRFDPYPFQLLTLVVSLEAIFLTTFIMISQNRQGRLADRRNYLDLQINLLAEQENTKMLQLLKGIAEKLGVDPTKDPEVEVLEQATRPEKLVEQIDESIKETKRENATE